MSVLSNIQISTRAVCVVLTLVGPFLDVFAQSTIKDDCGIQASENAYPWLVGIEFQGNVKTFTEVKCSGAFINRRHVVSNAACFNKDEEAKSVVYGSNITISGRTCSRENNDKDCRDDGANRVPIELVILHPEFSSTSAWSSSGESYHDIAMIRLREAVPYTDDIRPICLPSADLMQLAKADRELHLAGIYYDAPIAYTQENLGPNMTYLNREEFRMIDNRHIMAEDHIAADGTSEPNIFYLCMITGGLLMNKRGENYELVGLLEFTSGCLTTKLFTNVYLYLDWIRSLTPEWSPCGRRRVEHVELIVNGEATKAGDWPWHAAIYRVIKSSNKYTCGGTLISKTMVLTAAHCVAVSGVPVNPEILTVILGKYYLIGANVETQERKVHSLVVHKKFSPRNYLENDIALLKLDIEVIYSDYIQPACVWYNEAYGRLSGDTVFGTVVGWGYDESDELSSQLKQARLPKLSDTTCIEKNPLFYSNVLSNHKKFCAGWANGTSPCNGDSGGGFLIFLPDTAKTNSTDALGTWYVGGIVSMTASLKNYAQCDPYQYVVFTDVDKYTDWIRDHLDN